MANTLSFTLTGLPTGIAGNLRAQFYNGVDNSTNGSAISAGFAELANGFYVFYTAAVPANLTGYLKFYRSDTSAVVGLVSINPQTTFAVDSSGFVTYNNSDPDPWSIAIPGSYAPGTAGYILGNDAPAVVAAGTAQAGAVGSITLAAGDTAVNGFYNGCSIKILSGTGAGQDRRVQGYNSTTKVATVEVNWITAPDNTSVYRILSDDAGNVLSLNAAALQQIAAAILVTAANKIATDASGNVTTGAVTAGVIATDVWNALRATYKAAGSFGALMQGVRDGTAQAGGANTITLDTGASAVNNFYNNTLLEIVGGTGVGQSLFITGYNGTTKVATMNANWVVAPDNTSQFAIQFYDNIPGGAPPSLAQIKAAILKNAANPILADANGYTTLAAAGLDQILTEGTTNARQTLALLLDAVAGILSGAAGLSITIKDPTGTATRIAATVDANGNRTAITLTPPA